MIILCHRFVILVPPRSVASNRQLYFCRFVVLGRKSRHHCTAIAHSASLVLNKRGQLSRLPLSKLSRPLYKLVDSIAYVSF
jgi:hypothetical protein